jgi:hypothetical protein
MTVLTQKSNRDTGDETGKLPLNVVLQQYELAHARIAALNVAYYVYVGWSDDHWWRVAREIDRR